MRTHHPETFGRTSGEFLRAFDRLASRFLAAARELREPAGGDMTGLVEELRQRGLELTDDLFFRQRFELEFASREGYAALDMADRALKLVDLLVSTENRHAQRYLRRVSDCYVRGLSTETVIMCGAVLETVLEDVLSDESEIRKALKLRGDARVYPGHRLSFVRKRNLWDRQIVDLAEEVIGDRNDAVQFTPGLVARPLEAIQRLAIVLRAIVPSPGD